MTTPYGTTTFRKDVGGTVASRRIEATDPAGGTERLEFYLSDNTVSSTVPSGDVPTGFSASNAFMDSYNAYYWDKPAFAAGAGDRAKAVNTNWMLAYDTSYGHPMTRNVPHSIKQPLESRVWFRYPNQGSAAHHALGDDSGTQPVLIGRVLEGGVSQITQVTYNAHGLVTSRLDPVGRQTTYTYAANGLDLLQVEQVRGGGTDVLQVYDDYTAGHLPGTITDAAAQTTTMTYNAAGQPLTVTNALNETTTYTYESVTSNLLTVTGPVSGATTTYTYDAYGRIESTEDADGYVVLTDYDALNRVTQRTYPDDTTETLTYSRLDLAEQKDRLGRITRHFYDRFGRRAATRDPAGRTLSQVWCDCGALDALIDANGNRTKWERDVQGRVTREIRADNTTDTLYTYDLSGRLKTVTDPKDQVTTHSYHLDDSLSGTAYTDEVISTPDVSYTYDPYYARVVTMLDGIGTTSYTYKTPGTNGAGQVASVDGPLSNDTITYTYDQLGRVTVRAINGAANTVTWVFDALGRVTAETNLLGAFAYTYDGVTSRLATVTYPNDQTSTYSYFDNAGDRRLQTIHHKYPNTSTLSKFDYTYDAVGNILTWRQQADTTAVTWAYGYDPADQLTSAVKNSTSTPATILQRYAYAYDPAGNRTIEQVDDAVTLSAYDNLNRLTSQAPGGPMIIAGTLNEPGTVTISGTPAVVDSSNNFRGTVATVTGTNTFTIVAKDATGNTTSQEYAVDVAGTGRTFAYDANGNVVADGSRTFTWDALDRVGSVSLGSRAVAFDYDGLDQRVHRTSTLSGILEQETRIVMCDEDTCETRDAAGTNILGRSFPRGEDSSGGTYFVDDHLGSVEAVTDMSSSVTGRLSYSPVGSQTVVSGSSPTQGFAAYYSDAALPGLWFTKYRVLDSGASRWLSEDPIGLADDKNLYRYVANRSLTLTDPSGLAAWLRCEYIKRRSEPSGYRINYKIPFRHCYVDVACDSASAILEMWGPKNAGDKYRPTEAIAEGPESQLEFNRAKD